MKQSVSRWRRCVMVFAVAYALMPAPLNAAVPHLVRYQGQAVDNLGVPLQGPYNLTFRLYDADAGGTIVWQEQQANIPINKGHFSVLLGQVTALNVDWSKSLWLTIQVGTDPELLPRQRITSVPLAVRAEVAEGLTTPLATSTITDDANKLVPTGAIILWAGGSCPTGYARLSSLDGKFLVSDTNYNPAAGGSNTKDLSHTHGPGSYAGPSHTHTLPGEDVNFGGSGPVDDWRIPNQAVGGGVTNAGGTGPVTGTSATGGSASLDIRPAYATILLCQKN